MQNKPIKTIFVCEFITSGGLNDSDLPSGLLAQGLGMRDALLHDLSDLPYEVITTVDVRVTLPTDCHTCYLVDADDDVWGVWEEIVGSVDAVWLVAPETGGDLSKLTALALAYNKCILGCGLTAVNTCSSKLATYALLQQADVNTMATYQYDLWPKTKGVAWLAKPDDGAGCEETVVFDSALLLEQWLLKKNHTKTHVIQPYLQGAAGSIACVMNKGAAYLLSCNKQLIKKENNELSYKGCLVNGMQQYWTEFAALANQVAQLLPDLTGYVGIDVIVGDEGGGEVVVVEINPRLTTSYMALKEATGYNPAELLIKTLTQPDYEWPTIQHHEVMVEFAHA